MIYPNDMDKEMISLCDALNTLPNIKTMFSCCGHIGKETWYISLSYENIDVMHLIIERFSHVRELQFYFAFFDNNRMGIYSDVLGNMSPFMQERYHEWLIIQIEKIKLRLKNAKLP